MESITCLRVFNKQFNLLMPKLFTAIAKTTLYFGICILDLTGVKGNNAKDGRCFKPLRYNFKFLIAIPKVFIACFPVNMFFFSSANFFLNIVSVGLRGITLWCCKCCRRINITLFYCLVVISLRKVSCWWKHFCKLMWQDRLYSLNMTTTCFDTRRTVKEAFKGKNLFQLLIFREFFVLIIREIKWKV